jgi:ABC-2 type transport system ATP-binding protein
MEMVVAEGLEKRFGDTPALGGVDLEVGRGTVFGLLGPNGAGKTTTVRILSTLLRADAGRAFVDGIDVGAEPRRARTRIGLTGQFAALDERLTPRENLAHVGRLLHLPRDEVRHRCDVLFRRLDLAEVADRPAQSLSGGTRRRVDIAMSLVGDPPVLFLDEPTTGLDPRSRLAVWELVAELTGYGTTVLLTSQYLDEVDRLAHQVAVIDGGRVIAVGSPGELKRRVGGDRITVDLRDPLDAPEATRVLARHAVGEVVHVEDTVVVPVAGTAGVVPSVVRDLDAAGIAISDVSVRRSTLDDVFFALTGHGAPDQGTGAS